MTDGYLANGSEPWLIPDPNSLKEIPVHFVKENENFIPYKRDDSTLARQWAIPGTAGHEHRIGGIEKADGSGNISYDPENHEKMIKLRAAKIDGIANDIPLAEIDGAKQGDLLVIGWGGTYGAIKTAVDQKQAEGKSVSHLHLKYIFPFQKNIGEILSGFKNILVPELNNGQLIKILRSNF